MLPALMLAITSTISVPCVDTITPLECKLGNRVLNLKQELEDARTDFSNCQRQLLNCHTAIEVVTEEPKSQVEDTLSKPAIAGLATGAAILGSILTVVAIKGGDTGQVVALSVGGTAIAATWIFALAIW